MSQNLGDKLKVEGPAKAMAQGVGRGEKHLVVGAWGQCGGVVKEAIGRGRWGRGLKCYAKELGPSPVGQQFPAS